MSKKRLVKLTVLVPAYNEEATIKKVLEALTQQKEVFEIVVIDDASTDSTFKTAKSYKSEKIRVIQHKKNKGKGGAIQTGLSQAKGNFVLIQDADLEYDPREIEKLLEPIYAGRTDVVFGSRFSGSHTNMFYWHFMGNKFLNFAVNILYDSILSDMETCYKVMPMVLMRELQLQENDFRIEPEITCKLLRKKVKILEVPITYVGRTYKEGKKITWIDGFKALSTIIGLKIGTQ